MAAGDHGERQEAGRYDEQDDPRTGGSAGQRDAIVAALPGAVKCRAVRTFFVARTVAHAKIKNLAGALMSKAKVAVLKPQPQTVLNDYQRLMELVNFQTALDP